jgi:hypothetical protein
MRFDILALLAVYATSASAGITYTIRRANNPSADQQDAYQRIERAVSAAVNRYNRLTKRANKSLTIEYNTGVQTADGSFNGNIRFGSNRSYMNERTALHEIAHTLGVGQTRAFDDKCKANNWPQATQLLRSWDGQSAKINCGGGHFWPYGLNYDNEWSETNGERHCLMVDAMLADGLAG